MVIELNITKVMIDQDWEFGRTWLGNYNSLYLFNGPNEWLKARGHDAEIIVDEFEPYDRDDFELKDYYIQFDDPKLAMLFKLTWM